MSAVLVGSLADGQLADSTGDLYTTPVGTQAVLSSIHLTNRHSSAITVNIWLLPSGGTARLISPVDLSIGVGYGVEILDNETTLSTGDKIRGDGSTADKVDYVISGYETSGGSTVGATGDIGGWAIPFSFGTDTGGTPEDEYIEYNNATPSSTTEVYIDDTDRNGVDLDALLDLIAAGDSIKIFEEGTPTNWHIFTITSAADSGDFHTFGVTYVAGNGTFANNDSISFTWVEKGTTGDTGPVDTSGTPVDDDYAKFTDADTIEGRSYSEVRADLNVANGADVTGSNAPQAHKDLHDPHDGADALDAAAPAELAGVQAAGEGSSHSLARADHAHQVQESMADNHLVTVNQADVANLDIPRFTPTGGLAGLSYTELLAAIFSVALPENVSILLDPVLSTDGKWSGICETGTAGTDLTFGELVYFAVADSKWEKALATAAATAFGKLGIVVVAGLEDATVTLLLWGKVRADAAFPALTIGAPVYISKDTGGDITMTIPPKATNHVVRIIGHPKTADELWFTPDNTYLEYA